LGERGRHFKSRMKFFPSLKMVVSYSWTHSPKCDLKSSYRVRSLVGFCLLTAGK